MSERDGIPKKKKTQSTLHYNYESCVCLLSPRPQPRFMPDVIVGGGVYVPVVSIIFHKIRQLEEGEKEHLFPGGKISFILLIGTISIAQFNQQENGLKNGWVSHDNRTNCMGPRLVDVQHTDRLCRVVGCACLLNIFIN